jgi:cytochrome c biogenesis protein CcdA
VYGRLLASSLVLTAADGSSQTALALAAYSLGVVWEDTHH